MHDKYGQLSQEVHSPSFASPLGVGSGAEFYTLW